MNSTRSHKKSKSVQFIISRSEKKRLTRSENDYVQKYESEYEKKKKAILDRVVYKKDPNLDSKIRTLKHNNSVVFDGNFNLKKYQNQIIKLMSNKVDKDNLLGLKIGLYSIDLPKIKTSSHPYVQLAKRLEYKVPTHLTDRLYSIGLKKKNIN